MAAAAIVQRQQQHNQNHQLAKPALTLRATPLVIHPALKVLPVARQATLQVPKVLRVAPLETLPATIHPALKVLPVARQATLQALILATLPAAIRMKPNARFAVSQRLNLS